MIAVANELETLQELRNSINEQEYQAHHDPEKPATPQRVKKVQIMFELVDYVWTEGDELLYVPHTWEERIGELLVEAGIWEERVKKLWAEESLIVLTRELRDIPLQIPQGVLKWAGYDERAALETNLYQVLEALIAHDYRGTKWNGRVELRELKAKLRHIRFPTENVE